jgi:glutamyl-tRNA synthetase
MATGPNTINTTQQRLDALERRYLPRALPPGAAVVRLAPSPTGRPHIGTALQAVINYALAHQGEGIFILRIEDTDRKRLVPGAIESIMDALRWLELHPDEGPSIGGAYGPYLESERLDLYRTVANWLVAHGHA